MGCLTRTLDRIMPLLCSKSSPLGHAACSWVGYPKHQPPSWLAFDCEFNGSLLITKWYKFPFLSIPCKSDTMNSDSLYYLIIEFVCLVPTNKPLGTFSLLHCVGRKDSLIRLGGEETKWGISPISVISVGAGLLWKCCFYKSSLSWKWSCYKSTWQKAGEPALVLAKN